MCLIVRTTFLVQLGSIVNSFTHHCFCTISANASIVKKDIICFIVKIVQPGTSSFISYVMLNRSDQSIKSCLLFFGSTAGLVGS